MEKKFGLALGCGGARGVAHVGFLKALEENGILGGYPLGGNRILWCCTEMNTKAEIDAVVSILKEV